VVSASVQTPVLRRPVARRPAPIDDRTSRAPPPDRPVQVSSIDDHQARPPSGDNSRAPSPENCNLRPAPPSQPIQDVPPRLGAADRNPVWALAHAQGGRPVCVSSNCRWWALMPEISRLGSDSRVSGDIEILSNKIWITKANRQTESFRKLAMLHVNRMRSS
jgi:hypothetical protein